MDAFGVFADRWAGLALAATWQLAALAVVALICERLFRLRQPRVRHALWWFVLVAPLVLAPGRAALERRDATVAIIVPESVGRALEPARAPYGMVPPVLPSLGEEVASAPRGAAAGSYPAEDVPVAASAQATSRAASWWEQIGLAEALFALWVAGVLVFALRLLAGHRCVRRMLSKSAPVEHAGALEALTALQAEAGLRRRIALRLSAAIGAPLLYGLRRPVVLIPPHWLESLSDAEMRALLAHEVAHVKRRDCFANLLQRLAEIPLFFHPGAWFASRRITGAREELADVWALARSGDPATYARSLAAAAERANARLAVASVGVAENKSTLCRRVEEIMNGEQRRRVGRPAAVALGAILLATAVAAAMVVTEVAESQVRPGAGACRPALVLENGQPAAWATVTLLDADPAQKMVVADGEGIADIDLSQLPQPVRFFAESGDRTQQALIAVDLSGGAGEEFTVVLHPLGRATGEVLDERGQGVPGVAVELTPLETLDGKAAMRSGVTDEQGRYDISGLIRDLYYNVYAYQGAKNSPTGTWSSRPFKVAASDGWFNVDVMVPASQPDAARSDGSAGPSEMRGETPTVLPTREVLIYDTIELKHVLAGRLCHLFGGTLVGEPGAEDALSALLPRNRRRVDAGRLGGLGGGGGGRSGGGDAAASGVGGGGFGSGGSARATSGSEGALRDLLPHGIVLVIAPHYESHQLLVQGTPDAITKLRELIRLLDRAPQRVRLTAALYPGKLEPGPDADWTVAQRWPTGGSDLRLCVLPPGKESSLAALLAGFRAEPVTVETAHLIPAVLVLPAVGERPQMVMTATPMVHPDGTVTIATSRALRGDAGDPRISPSARVISTRSESGSTRVNVLWNSTWLEEWGSGDAYVTLAMTVTVLPQD